MLAGAGGLHQSVTWARLLRSRPATLGTIEPGELWILSPGALQQAGDARSQARLIRDVSAAGVAAFVIAERLTPEALDEANSVGVPVVLLPPDAVLADVEKGVVEFVVDRDRAIGQRVQHIYDRLLSTLVEDSGAELLADIVHEVTGKAVYLLDQHFQASVQSGGTATEARLLGLLRRRFWETGLSGQIERLITLRPTEGDPFAALVRPLTLRGSVEGYLVLLGPRDDFGDFDYQVAGRTTSVLAIELAKQSALVEARLRVQGDFLEELLDSPTPRLEQLSTRAAGLGYDLTAPHLVFVLRPRIDEGSQGARQYARFVDLARRRLVLANVSSLLRERDGSVQVLAPCPPGLSPTATDEVVAWVENVRAGLVETLQPDPLPIAAGVGRSADGRGVTFYAALREAIQAAEIASSMEADSGTLHFGNLGALRLIFHLANNPELRSFQRDMLGPLEEYDRLHRGEFVQTLEAFFRAGGNHVQAAREIHVHRNTLIYRLDRIRDLLGGADLENADIRLNLQLALKIRSSFGVAA